MLYGTANSRVEPAAPQTLPSFTAHTRLTGPSNSLRVRKAPQNSPLGQHCVNYHKQYASLPPPSITTASPSPTAQCGVGIRPSMADRWDTTTGVQQGEPTGARAGRDTTRTKHEVR
ncbi:hypothetical protein EJ06DRAFT_236843 [Trichodelitschia bisporula]|uniref:Uncharacterized protein n=1 Tax=Trichodelitschia bisporula TaxID=703511 RepID=A0A6G1HKK0_9PEZI|nr:hypothetical protein EJ06DRAFT_236843 [Trichodelitschia bisporula]